MSSHLSRSPVYLSKSPETLKNDFDNGDFNKTGAATSLTSIIASDTRSRRGGLYLCLLAVFAVAGYVWHSGELSTSVVAPVVTGTPVIASEPAAFPTATPALDAKPEQVLVRPAPRARFAHDSARLAPAALTTLDIWTSSLKADRRVMLQIEGHADERGSSKYNYRLGMRRAHAAKAYLVANGIAPQRISVMSYGKSRPLSHGRTESNLARNRRIEMRTMTGVASR